MFLTANRNRRWHLVETISLLLVAMIPAGSRADGGFLPPFGYEIYEPGQTAFISYDSATATETLSILPKFDGEPTDFAWLVPLPTLPQVEVADADLFRQLSALTSPVRRSRESIWSCERYDYATGAAERDDNGVEIIDDRLIGIYRTMTLGADDVEALVDSLTTWGFLHEGNLEVAMPLLGQYVAEGWYFVTMTIDSTAVAGAGWPYGKLAAEAIAPYYWYPSLQPITFTFAADEIIYPLRISRLSAPPSSAVLLFVAADHRLTFPRAETRYANRLTDAELAAVRRLHPLVGDALRPGTFLTKLYRDTTPAQMDADLVLTQAPDDGEFLPVFYSGVPVWSLSCAGFATWWLGRRLLGRRRPGRRARGRPGRPNASLRPSAGPDRRSDP